MTGVQLSALRRDAVAGARRALPVAVGFAFWFLLPALCVLAFGLGADRLARHVDSTPSGSKGSFVVTSHNCQRDLCITSGTFTSDDGTIVERGLVGDYRWNLRKTYRVVYEGNADDVVPLGASWDPASTIVAMSGAVGFLALWGWCVRSRRAGGSVR